MITAQFFQPPLRLDLHHTMLGNGGEFNGGESHGIEKDNLKKKPMFSCNQPSEKY